MNMKMILTLAATAAIACSAMAETRTWRGGSGNWSVPGNWEENAAPQNGDSVVFTSCADVITVTNDIPNLELARVTLVADTYSSAIVLTGEKLKLTGAMPVWRSGCVFTNAMPLVVANNTTPTAVDKCNIISEVGGIAFLGDIEALGNFNCRLPNNASNWASFYGSVFGENAYFYTSGWNNSYSFNKPIDVKGIIASTAWCTGVFRFTAAGNSWTTNDISYSSQFIAATANAFPTNMVMRWNERQPKYDETGVYQFIANQTIDRIETSPIALKDDGSIPANKFRILGSGATAYTLTLRASASASCYAQLASAGISLVYDPMGDYTQTFVDRAHSTSAKITIRGGTLESCGNNTFAALTGLEVSSGAKFKVSANGSGTAVNPLSGVNADAVVAYGGKLEVCSDVTLTLKKLRANGVCVPVGTYQALDGTDPDAEKVSWIEGSGLVSVAAVEDATYWKAAVSGSWNDAENWTDGVPTAGKATYVTVGGADYTVTVPAGTTLPNNITVGNDGGTARMAFASGNHSTSSWNWTLENGGVVEVPTGANVVCDANKTGNVSVHVNGGGEFLVSGGDVVFTNANNSTVAGFVVAGENALTGRVTITAGALRYVPWNYRSKFNLNAGGLLDLQGGVFHVPSMASATDPAFIMRGGEFRASGGEYRTTGGDYSVGWPTFSDEKTVFSGNSVFAPLTSDRLRVKPSASGKSARLEFSGSSTLANRCGQFEVGGVADSSSVIVLGSDAISGVATADSMYVGMDAGFGELDVSAGYASTAEYGLVVGCASAKTKTTDGVEGIVKVSGGSLYVKGSDYSAGWKNGHYNGLTVGDGSCTAVRSGRPYVGGFELTGGSVTNNAGPTVLGMGYGEGTFRQSGGVYRANAAAMPVAVGMGGGIGSLEISGGEFITASANANVYVGGVGTNVFGRAHDATAYGYPIDRHDAQGTFSFSDGTVSVAGSVVLGADGNGTLERIGTNGTFTIGKNLVFSNTVENASSGGTLAFKIDNSGKIGPINVTGKVVIDSNAKLTVDTGDVVLDDIRGTLLAAAGGVEGDFAADAVTFTGANAKGMAIRWRPDGTLTISKQKGFTIIFR